VWYHPEPDSANAVIRNITVQLAEENGATVGSVMEIAKLADDIYE